MMDWQTSNEFDSIMRDAKWEQDKAEYYESQTFYNDAKSWYMKAMFTYERAYDLAYKYDDYRKNEPDQKKEHCRSKITDMVYKQYDKERKYLEERERD